MTRLRAAAVAVAVLLAGLGTGPVAAAATCGPNSSPATGLVREAHPVVIAHGWTGKPLHDTRKAFETAMPKGWQFLLFDYHAASSSWASAPGVAGCFATYLKGVSDAHRRAGGDGLVYVVGHSMGGLALRFAVDPAFGKVPALGSRIGGLVTLGTPHRGSPWGNSGVYTQVAEITVERSLDPVLPAEAARRCLAPHDGGRGLPAGCDAPPYLPLGVRVDQIAGVATVRRSFFGIHAYDILLGGDSIVSQSSAQGYLGSARGQRRGMSTRSTQVSCSLDMDAFAPVLGGGVLGTLARLKIDGAAMDAVQGERTSAALVEFLLAANVLMPCSHVGITTFAGAIGQAAEALRAGAAANAKTSGGAVTVTALRDRLARARALQGRAKARYGEMAWGDGWPLYPSRDGAIAFESPSGNIRCLMSDRVWCQIAEHEYRDPPPKDCGDTSWLPEAFVLSADAATHGTCTGGIVTPYDAHSLPYEEALVVNGYGCFSNVDGVGCVSLTGPHGFLISRAGAHVI